MLPFWNACTRTHTVFMSLLLKLSSFPLCCSFAPESIKNLEQFVKDFFVGLPCATVICVTLLGGAYASLLQELLLYPSWVHAWMLFSRLNSKSQPIVVLLPVNTILEGTLLYMSFVAWTLQTHKMCLSLYVK